MILQKSKAINDHFLQKTKAILGGKVQKSKAMRYSVKLLG
jgi:hypothetical protein